MRNVYVEVGYLQDIISAQSETTDRLYATVLLQNLVGRLDHAQRYSDRQAWHNSYVGAVHAMRASGRVTCPVLFPAPWSFSNHILGVVAVVMNTGH